MTKEEQYQAIVPQIQALMAGETDEIAKMANMVAVLHETFGFWWMGFYRVAPEAGVGCKADEMGGTGVGELVLGPFQGPIACTRIPYNKGVCGRLLGHKRKPSSCRMSISFPATLLVRALRKARLWFRSSGTERSLRSSTSIVPTSIPSMKSTEFTLSNYLTISSNLSNPLHFPKKNNKSASKVQIFYFFYKIHTFLLHISKKSCTFAAQNESFAVFSPRRGNMFQTREGIQDILKKAS